MTLLSGLARKIVSWEVWGFPNIIHEIRIFARWWFTSKRLLRWRDDFTSKKFPICVMTTYLQKVFHVGVDDLHPRDFHICMTMTYIRKVSTFGVKVHIQEIPTRMAYIQDFSTLARWFTSQEISILHGDGLHPREIYLSWITTRFHVFIMIHVILRDFEVFLMGLHTKDFMFSRWWFAPPNFILHASTFTCSNEFPCSLDILTSYLFCSQLVFFVVDQQHREYTPGSIDVGDACSRERV